MLSSVDAYFRDFRPTRALHLFLLFGIIGTLVLVGQWHSAVSAPMSVVGYSLLLYIAQNQYRIELTDTVKDSPYFLGFALTLVALWFVFDQAPKGGTVTLNGLSGSIGAALGTTIAGLLARQTLHSRGVLEEERGAILRNLRNELTQHTETFADSQSRLVSLIQEFVSTREELFSEEERAAQEYVDQIKRSGHLLDEVDETYRSKLREFRERVSDQLEALEATLEASRNRTEEMEKNVEAALGTYRAQSQELLEISLQQNERAQSELRAALEANRGLVNDAIQRHEQRVRRLSAAADEYLDAEETAGGAIRELSEDLAAARSELRRFRERLSEIPDIVEQLPEELESAMRNLGEEAEKASSELSETLNRIVEDVHAIDQIVDEVVEVLSERLRQVS